MMTVDPLTGMPVYQPKPKVISSGGGGGAGGRVDELVAGSNISIDNSNPRRPIISATSSGSGGFDTDDQTASEVPFTPTGRVSATNVQTAIAELDTEKTDELTAIAYAVAL